MCPSNKAGPEVQANKGRTWWIFPAVRAFRTQANMTNNNRSRNLHDGLGRENKGDGGEVTIQICTYT